jgi:hypothetical protein
MTSSGRRLTPCLALVAGCLAAPVQVASGSVEPGVEQTVEPEVETFRPVPETSGVAARDVPLEADLLNRPLRTKAVDLVGVTWRGEAPPVRVRTRSDRTWSGWRPTEVMDDGPDSASAEAGGVTGTDLLWVGDADRVEVDVRGPRPAGLTLAMIDVAGGVPAPRASAAVADTNEFRPRVLGRDRWGADPRLRDGRPSYNRTIQQLHVHHTVNSNDYSAADVPGLIRGMYRYHTVNLGWSDIGYNFLVDRFGRTWTGRAGGIKRAVRGAHTLGFNSTSTGVALIGNFQTVTPSRRARTGLVHLAAWKLNKYDRNPLGRVVVFSHGSDRYPFGTKVRLPVLDGHRDTNQTACPGALLYQRLPDIRLRVAKRINRFR